MLLQSVFVSFLCLVLACMPVIILSVSPVLVHCVSLVLSVTAKVFIIVKSDLSFSHSVCKCMGVLLMLINSIPRAVLCMGAQFLDNIFTECI